MERKNIWTTYGEAELKELNEVNEKYKDCLIKVKQKENV